MTDDAAFKNLIVYQRAYDLTKKIWELMTQMHFQLDAGIIDQLRRSSVSVPANIAEGYHRRHAREKYRYAEIAMGSLSETRVYLSLLRDLEYLKGDELEAQARSVSQLLAAYMRSLDSP